MAISSIQPGNDLNKQRSNPVVPHSRFNRSYHNFGTYRFGEIAPFFVDDLVAGDTVPLRSSHTVRSYTLKSPLMQNISLKKDFFNVPMESILPLNWDKVFTNPMIGDDVPQGVNCSLPLYKVITYIKNYFLDLSNKVDQEEDVFYIDIIRATVILESFFSNGSLLASLGCHLAKYFVVPKFDYKVDNYFNSLWTQIVDKLFGNNIYFNFVIGSTTYTCRKDYTNQTNACSVRRFIELCRDNPNISFTQFGAFNPADFADYFNDHDFDFIIPNNSELGFNFARVCAYQLVCAHYYSNDRVDYIYSASLYRDYIYNLYKRYLESFQGSFDPQYFVMNGISYLYDSLSGSILETMLSGLVDASWLSDGNLYQYFYSLFGFNRSLRFSDYFTGSKSQPLAVGNTNVAVGSDNNVSIIDVTKKIQIQRFLNSVNRSGRKFSQYIKGIFGVTPSYDYHDPLYIGHTSDDIVGVENANTGSDQLTKDNSVTSVLRSFDSRYAFEFESDRPSVVIGLCYFDIARVYTSVIERQYFHQNRFDMFNPQLQMIGDQVVYLDEVGSSSDGSVFSYQTRHSEYKQRVNQCFGGFVSDLPSWIFKDDIRDRGEKLNHISPDFIRSSNTELDPFYVSLSGYGLASYFHFIIDHFNDCEYNRPMIKQPNIL